MKRHPPMGSINHNAQVKSEMERLGKRRQHVKGAHTQCFKSSGKDCSCHTSPCRIWLVEFHAPLLAEELCPTTLFVPWSKWSRSESLAAGFAQSLQSSQTCRASFSFHASSLLRNHEYPTQKFICLAFQFWKSSFSFSQKSLYDKVHSVLKRYGSDWCME